MRLTDRTYREEPKSLNEISNTELRDAFRTTHQRLLEARERHEFLYATELKEELNRIQTEWKARKTALQCRVAL